jgi:spermidine dehydrogenase
MSRPLNITRRDFLNGVALTVVAGGAAPFGCARSAHTLVYPPALTGLRGAHAGSFETAHALAWDGKSWERPAHQTDNTYDLIVVGGGLSGLAAAHHFQREAGEHARILILDNHDDFGGHAKRNEFDVDGRLLIGYGGSQSIDGPAHYSPQARKLLEDLGVHTERFYDYFDQGFYDGFGLNAGMYLDRKSYGADQLADLPIRYWGDEPDLESTLNAISLLPFPDDVREHIGRVLTAKIDHLTGKSVDEKIAYLRTISYEEFLRRDVGAPEELLTLLRRTVAGLWGAGWDVLSALEAARLGMPCVGDMGLGAHIPDPYDGDEPYIFHFPDGNASLARLLVRKLSPRSAPGDTMEDIILAPVDYDMLDRRDARVRIRLNSTAVDVRHTPDKEAVDVVYVTNDEARRVRGRSVILACYSAIAPYLCPEMKPAQREAIESAEKIPLVYVNVALRNWRAIADAGYHRLYAPQAFFESVSLDFPVSIGDYHFARTPDDPIILHMQPVPI